MKKEREEKKIRTKMKKKMSRFLIDPKIRCERCDDEEQRQRKILSYY